MTIPLVTWVCGASLITLMEAPGSLAVSSRKRKLISSSGMRTELPSRPMRLCVLREGSSSSRAATAS